MEDQNYEAFGAMPTGDEPGFYTDRVEQSYNPTGFVESEPRHYRMDEFGLFSLLARCMCD